MATPRKSKRDLFAAMEDDLKQFWAALSGSLRAAPRAIAERVGLAPPARNDQPVQPKVLGGGQVAATEPRQSDLTSGGGQSHGVA